MNDKIMINNQNILNYVMFKLDKLENGFTKDELLKITEIVVNYHKEQEESSNFFLEFLKFDNLKALTLRNGYIFNDDYQFLLKLTNLTNITFDHCEFENADLITSLKLNSLSIINCKINNYTFINLFQNLKSLTIINGKVSINKINTLKNLEYLNISYSTITDTENTLNINSLMELHLDNTNITDLTFINNLSNLKKLTIDALQYNNNKEQIDNLKNINLTIKNNLNLDMDGEGYEI